MGLLPRLLVITGLAASPVQARPIVLELFTSQGCSSCPPADALLTELAANPDFLPLGFHVDYWNRLGWEDRYSSRAFSERQNYYAGVWGSSRVYTPQLVINGRREAVGSDRRAVAAAIDQARSDAGVDLRIERDGARLAIDVAAAKGSGSVILVGFDAQHETAIGSGENGGRRLIESNIVRSFTKLGDWNGQSLRLAAAPPQGERTAVLLQGSDGAILGAAVLQP